MKFQIVSVIAALALITPVLAMPHDDHHPQKCELPISSDFLYIINNIHAKQATHTYVFLLLRMLFFSG